MVHFCIVACKIIVKNIELNDLLGKDLEQELVQGMVAVQEQDMAVEMVEEPEHS